MPAPPTLEAFWKVSRPIGVALAPFFLHLSGKPVEEARMSYPAGRGMPANTALGFEFATSVSAVIYDLGSGNGWPCTCSVRKPYGRAAAGL